MDRLVRSLVVTGLFNSEVNVMAKDLHELVGDSPEPPLDEEP